MERIMKLIAVLLCVIIIGSMTLLALGRMGPMAFWITAAFCAFSAFVILPLLKKK